MAHSLLGDPSPGAYLFMVCTNGVQGFYLCSQKFCHSLLPDISCSVGFLQWVGQTTTVDKHIFQLNQKRVGGYWWNRSDAMQSEQELLTCGLWMSLAYFVGSSWTVTRLWWALHSNSNLCTELIWLFNLFDWNSKSKSSFKRKCSDNYQFLLRKNNWWKDFDDQLNAFGGSYL